MLICGIDEAGRGPLAGPVVAAAVVFEDNFFIERARDSKVLDEYERESLFSVIANACVEYSISEISNSVIDEINILQATMLAMQESITKLTVKPDLYLIDGNYFRLKNNEHNNLNFKTIIKGDASDSRISCASILAKVTRDNIMKGYHLRFPEYEFHKHKGYATNSHYDKIKSFGMCDIHRKSFLRKLSNTKENYELYL